MATIYNLTGVTQANSTLEYATELSNIVPWFPIMLVVALFAILMLALKTEDIVSLLMVAGFFTTSISGLFWLAGYIPFLVFIFSLAVTVGAGLINMLQSGG